MPTLTIYSTAGSGNCSVQQPISTVLSIGMQVTGTSAFTPAIRTVATSTLVVLISMTPIVEDMAGVIIAEATMLTITLSIVLTTAVIIISACATAGTVETIVVMTATTAAQPT